MRWKWDSAHHARRCGHSYCTDCATRRGRNRGNRRVRHAVRQMMGNERKEARSE